jgi:anaerobic selenocysteine-containing dehydrogenase
MGPNGFFEALGTPHPSVNGEIGDDHQGVGITLGKIMFADSADNWFHADTILVWGANPAYTNIPNFHYLAEARYNGRRVISISPDYNASALHADLWVPVNIGTDAALALAAAQIIVREKLYREDFVREQTDLPLLVREDNGKFLREKDFKSGGREDIFYWYDETSARVVEAPRKTLALDGLTPALEGVYEVRALSGTIKVRPVFVLLSQWLDDKFTPEKAAAITGVPPALIERLAERCHGPGVVTSRRATGKIYHGDLIERAIFVVRPVRHIGRKGVVQRLPGASSDTALAPWSAAASDAAIGGSNDPRYSA